MNTNIMAEKQDMINLDSHHELRLDQNMVYQASKETEYSTLDKKKQLWTMLS